MEEPNMMQATGFVLGMLLNPEGGGSMFLQNSG
jgi:hypothetical protein